MKKQFKKWTFRLIAIGLFLFGLLILFMLNPILLYANKTLVGNYSIYHNKPIDKNFQCILERAESIIKSSELYDPELKKDKPFREALKSHVDFGSHVAKQNSHAKTDDELHPLREVPKWGWQPGNE